jgi:hypothetical protein
MTGKHVACMCGQLVSFGMSSGQVRESWECGNNDKANILQVHPSTDICQMKVSVIYLAPCTVHSYWYVCEMQWSWECIIKIDGCLLLLLNIFLSKQNPSALEDKSIMLL